MEIKSCRRVLHPRRISSNRLSSTGKAGASASVWKVRTARAKHKCHGGDIACLCRGPCTCFKGICETGFAPCAREGLWHFIKACTAGPCSKPPCGTHSCRLSPYSCCRVIPELLSEEPVRAYLGEGRQQRRRCSMQNEQGGRGGAGNKGSSLFAWKMKWSLLQKTLGRPGPLLPPL